MTDVLRYTQSLAECAEVDCRMSTTKYHREQMNRGFDVEYHDKRLKEIADGTYDFKCKFEIVTGRKYYKVVYNDAGHRSVHCFVDKVTGDVYKSASWNAPAKGVRYNLLNEDSRELCYSRVDWAGGYLYA
jgi:hypothetical protein